MSIERNYFAIVGTAKIAGFVNVKSEVSYEGIYETETPIDRVYITTNLSKANLFTEEQDAWNSLNRIKTATDKIANLRVVKLNTVIDFENLSITTNMTELKYKPEVDTDYIMIE